MSNIRVRLYREENMLRYDTGYGEEASIPLEEYVSGVVASEIGNAPLEAGKAQAIIARSLAANYIAKDQPISDQSSKHQAFRASRLDRTKYGNAFLATEATEGVVLFYNGKLIETCAYSSSNGGRTVSSEERWGGVREYLIAQDDPWDVAACAQRLSSGLKVVAGHGVGMSQYGAIWAANHGVSCEDILSFYYPGTKASKRGEQTLIAASKLVSLFQQAVNEKWGYIWGAAGETWTQAKQDKATRAMTIEYGQQWVGRKVADCSGLFVWAYKQCGESIYHGSNTIWRSHLSAKGNLSKGKRVDGQELKIGSAVFQTKADSSQDDGEDQYHIGLYIGNNKVIEAQGTKEGVIITDLVKRDWEQWGELAKVSYNTTATGDKETTGGETMAETIIKYAYVYAENGGAVNFRSQPKSTASRIVRCPTIKTGEQVGVISDDGEWSKISYGGYTGYMMSKFLVESCTDSDADGNETVAGLVAQINALVAKLAARAT